MSKTKTLANLRPVRPSSENVDAAAAAAAFTGAPGAPAKPDPSLKRLSLDVPADLRQRLKQRAIVEDRPLRNIAIDAFEAYLAQNT